MSKSSTRRGPSSSTSRPKGSKLAKIARNAASGQYVASVLDLTPKSGKAKFTKVFTRFGMDKTTVREADVVVKGTKDSPSIRGYKITRSPDSFGVKLRNRDIATHGVDISVIGPDHSFVAEVKAKGRARYEVIADARLALAERAKRAGATPGVKLDVNGVTTALKVIATSATDLFGTTERAMTYIDRENFGGTGHSARELLAEGRAISVIARLDDLRYGSQG